MKENKEKKPISKWLVIVLAACLLVAAAACAFFLSGLDPQEEPLRESRLYWNVEGKSFRNGTNIRYVSDDGYVYMIFSVDGIQERIPVANYELATAIDMLDVVGLEFDKNGVAVDYLRASEFTGGILANKFFVTEITDNQVTCNSSVTLGGYDVTFELTAETHVYDVGTEGITCGIPGVIKEQDQITVVAGKDGSILAVFVYPYAQPGDLYWSVSRKYDSVVRHTTREPDVAGFYTYEMLCNGQQVTVQTRDYEVASQMDSFNAPCMGLTFDENGYVIEAVHATRVTEGRVFASYSRVMQVSGNMLYTKKLTGSGVGTEYSALLSEDCKIINTTSAGVRGEYTDLRYGDQIHALTDGRGKVCYVFITSRVCVDEYGFCWNFDYKSGATETERKPDANGVYHIKLACDGVVFTGWTKDLDKVNMLDTSRFRGVKLGEDKEILDVIPSNYVYGGSHFCSWYYVDKIEGDQITVSFTKTAGGETKVLTGTISKDVQVYNTSKMVSHYQGEVSTVQVGDQIYAQNDMHGQIRAIYVVNRYLKAGVYYNLERKWSDSKEETTRVPDANGDYVFRMAHEGKQVTIKTRSKQVANDIDSQVARVLGLVVDKNGYCTKAVHAKETEECKGSVTVSYVLVTAIRGNQVDTLKPSTGEKKTIYLAKDAKFMDVSALYDDHQGEYTKLRKGDKIHCLADQDKNTNYVYITDRYFDGGVYYNLDRKWDDENKCTTRTPDANGLYSFRMAHKGQVVTMQTKSLEVANAIDSQVAFVVALELDENGLITKAVHAKYAEECKGGITVSYVIVTKIDGDQVTTYKESTGETKTITLATDAQFINVSNLYDSFRGEYTQLRLGDKIHCLAEKGGKTNYVYITDRKFDGGIYYNLERKWNDTDKCTTRTPDANGLYSFRMAYKGQVVTMQTKSLEVANTIDSQVAFVVALELDENGLITKAVHAKYAEECKGGITVSYVIVTKIDGDQVTTYKESTGETKTITLATDAQFINVSNLYDSFRGEYTQLRLGDKIHCLAEKSGKTNYLFITSRKQVVVDHACQLNDADTVWYEWNGNTGFTENGYYILTKDVNRSKRITIKEGQEITLCLNGHTLTCEDRVFSIYGKLTICDHKHADGSYAGKIISNYSNTVDDQGNITGKVYGGIAYLYNETQDVELNIYGGNLVHKGTATAAGLIYVANMADSGFRAVLNLYDGVLSGGNVTESGGAVAVRNAGTFNMYGGKITGCKATTGAGVHAQSSQAVFRMEGGVIESCHSTDVGAGVCIGNGTAYMTGGEITGCTTTGNGGSVNITAGSFTMTGGSVEKGKAKEGGNLRVGTAATFTLGGNAIISGGEATNGGNAVVYGTLILQDQAVIKDGVASNKGGNINAFANLEEATANILMTGGKISGGVAAVDSGSIRLDANEGTVNMTVTGGTIEAGEAPYAPCVKVGPAEKIHLTVGGNVRIDQVHLESGKYMTIHEAGLENTSSIGVTVANGNKPFVTIQDPEDVNCFHSCTQDESQLVNENNGLYLKILHSHCQCGGNLTGEALNAHQCQSAQDFTAVDWTNFKDGGIFEKPGNYLNFVESGYYYLTSDVATGYVIEIKEGQQITLCLNGHTLRSDAGSSSAIRLKGELNICDCHGGGKITGKSTKAPGLVYMLTSASGTVFNLYGGDLVMTDRDYTANAGVIQVANNANYPVVFNMYGGTISGGTANKGGNVLIGSASGTMNMYGGAITGGAVQNNDGTEDRNRGGNIYVNGGTLNVYGGIISGGTADAQAVTPALGGDIFQKGGKVYLNTGFETLDYANDGVGYLTLGESFTANKVTCKTLAESAKLAEGTEEQAKVFEVSQADYEKRYENGAITMTQVALLYHSHCQCGGNLTGEALNAHQCQSAQDLTAVDWTNFKDGGIFEKPGNYLNFVESGYYYLTSDVATGYVIEIKEGQQITLCLNGHTLRSDAGSSSAIRLKGELNICDCHGGGKITGKSTKAPGLVYLLTSESGTVFNLYGGDLVMTDGDYTANAGVIQVANNANYPVVFNMYGGSISGGTANKGGNVLIGSASGTMNMYGGAITGGAVQNNDGTEDRNRGGNIYVNGGTLNVYGGIISGGTADAQAVTPALGGDIFQKGGKVYLNTGFDTLDYANDGVGYLTLGESFTANKVTCKTLAESAKLAEGTEEQAKVFEVSQADYEKRYENGAITMTQVALLYHRHCQCGGNLDSQVQSFHQADCQVVADWTAINQENFVVGELLVAAQTNGRVNFAENGCYYLEENVSTSSVLELLKDADITLCLNGYTLTSTATGNSAIRLSGKLNICDCQGGGVITGKSPKSAGLIFMLTSGADGKKGTTFNLYGGTLAVTDKNYTQNAGVLQVGNSGNNPGVFNMYGGTIRGGTANKGGNILIGTAAATMNLYGGSVEGGSVKTNDTSTDRNRGGNIYVNKGTLNVYGGIISGGKTTADDPNPGLGGDIYMTGGKVQFFIPMENLDIDGDGTGQLIWPDAGSDREDP